MMPGDGRGGFILAMASNNGTYSAMEPPDAEADFVEKDPTGRYVRVNYDTLSLSRFVHLVLYLPK